MHLEYFHLAKFIGYFKVYIFFKIGKIIMQYTCNNNKYKVMLLNLIKICKIKMIRTKNKIYIVQSL